MNTLVVRDGPPRKRQEKVQFGLRLRRIILLRTPLVLTILMIFHPCPYDDEVAAELMPIANWWIALHTIGFVLFALLGVALWMLTAGLEEGPDYYLLRLAEPYDPGDPRPTVDKRLPRTFPGDVKATNVITPAGSVVDDQSANYWVSPWEAPPSPPVPQTRTLEFNTDGTMTFFKSPSGSACVTVDGNPKNRVISISATSQVRVEFDTCASG